MLDCQQMDRTWPQRPFACIVLDIACRVRDESEPRGNSNTHRRNARFRSESSNKKRTHMSRAVTAALDCIFRCWCTSAQELGYTPAFFAAGKRYGDGLRVYGVIDFPTLLCNFADWEARITFDLALANLQSKRCTKPVCA